MSKPNILMIMADQLSSQWLGCYGHPVIKSPNVDQLARDGVTFDSAYCNSPICAPSRASMCTGRHVCNTRAYDNGSDFPSSMPTFMHHLRRSGYETILSGKMHFIGPDQLHGFERRLTTDIYPASFTWTPDWTRGAYPNHGTSVEQLKTAGLCDWSLQLTYDEEVAFRATEALRAHATKRKNARPFFLCASFTHPHDPFIITREFWDLYNDSDLPAPAARASSDPHPFCQWLHVHHVIDQHSPTKEQIHKARRAYFGMVSYFDSKVGQLVNELKRLKLYDNTIILITSDHGEMLGEHGMWFKRTYHDPSTRVPLIFHAPHQFVSNKRIAKTASLVDLYPTLLDIAQVDDREKIQNEIDGHSLLPQVKGESTDGPDHALIEYYSEGSLQPLRAVVQDNLKYVYVHTCPEQLFDLSKDPLEKRNVINEPAYSSRLTKLKQIVFNNWNPDDQLKQILASQQNRKWINQAMSQGRPELWDIQPHFDAKQQYVRTADALRANSNDRI